ncbi:MAG: hypothetical protein Q8K75_11725 [Chlamydiales bacterium]|nr:hypothetical protein [Chlamydiales bacterium]
MVSISLFGNQQIQPQTSFISKVSAAVTSAPQQFVHWITAKQTVAEPTFVQRLVRSLGLCTPCPTNGYEKAAIIAQRVFLVGAGVVGAGALAYGAGVGLEYAGNAAVTNFASCAARVAKNSKLECATDFENIVHHAGSWTKTVGEWGQVVPYTTAKYTATALYYSLDYATGVAKKAFDLFPVAPVKK